MIGTRRIPRSLRFYKIFELFVFTNTNTKIIKKSPLWTPKLPKNSTNTTTTIMTINSWCNTSKEPLRSGRPKNSNFRSSTPVRSTRHNNRRLYFHFGRVNQVPENPVHCLHILYSDVPLQPLDLEWRKITSKVTHFINLSCIWCAK